MKSSKTYIAVPPGYTIKEQIKRREMSQKEFAFRMNLPEKHVSKLMNGEVSLSQDVANRLEMVLGIEASFWNNLEAIYQEKLLKVELENQMDEDIKILGKIPYNEMVEANWIERKERMEDRDIQMRNFYEVANLTLLDEMLNHNESLKNVVYANCNDFAVLSLHQNSLILH